MTKIFSQLRRDFKEAKKVLCGKRKFPWFALVHNALCEKVTMSHPKVYFGNVIADIFMDGYRCLANPRSRTRTMAQFRQFKANRHALTKNLGTSPALKTPTHETKNKPAQNMTSNTL